MSAKNLLIDVLHENDAVLACCVTVDPLWAVEIGNLSCLNGRSYPILIFKAAVIVLSNGSKLFCVLRLVQWSQILRMFYKNYIQR